MRVLLRAGIAAALLAALFAAFAGVAAGQSPLNVRIREAALDDTGATRLVVSVTGDAVTENLAAQSFRVTEAGEPVEGVAVEPLLESRTERVSVALVMDVSGSTEGEPLANAKAAAKAFVDAVTARGVQVGIVAFNATAGVRSDFTNDRNALFATIDSLAAGGETALYDAVVLAAQQLAPIPGQHNMVVFSDGADTASTQTLEGSIAQAGAAQTPVTTVALLTEEFDKAPLDRLAAETGGRSLAVAQAASLGSAFQQVVEQLASQYVITYSSERAEPKELELAVSVTAGGVEATDAIVVSNNRIPPPPQAQPVSPPRPLIPAFASRTGFYAGIGAAFFAFALLLGVAVSVPRGGRAEKLLREGIRFYSRGGSEERTRKAGLEPQELARRAVGMVQRLPTPAGFEERLQQKLDRAGWPIRASEFLAIQVGAGFVAGLVGVALGSGVVVRLLVGLFAAAIGFFMPRLVLAQKIEKRTRAFLEQLPDTLQLLAGSLRAGYGILQAIDTVVQEAPDPTSTEFARALTEARLGMPLDEALEGMAERLGSEDFGWVVLAINIQRQVGGNLAALLETVGNTLREREMVRRQIKTLSAEGRLSAAILVALPFVLTLYMFLVNGEYISMLFTRTFGLVMVAGALVAIGIGIVWMRKLIDIEV